MRKLIYPTLIALFACSPMLMAEDVKVVQQVDIEKQYFDADHKKLSVDELYSRLSVSAQKYYYHTGWPGKPDFTDEPLVDDIDSVLNELVRRKVLVKKELVLAEKLEKLDGEKCLKYAEVMGSDRGALSYREMMGIGCEFTIRSFESDEDLKVICRLPADELKVFEKFIETGVIPKKPENQKKLTLDAQLQVSCENLYGVLGYVWKEENGSSYVTVDPNSVDKLKLNKVSKVLEKLVSSGRLEEQKVAIETSVFDAPNEDTEKALNSIARVLFYQYGPAVVQELLLGGIENKMKFQKLEKQPKEVKITVRLPEAEMKKFLSIKGVKLIPSAPEANKVKNN